MTPRTRAVSEVVQCERSGAVLVLTLNRPERMNAWNDELEDRYFALLDEAESDPQVRAIVVTGAGRAFCAGADLADLDGAEADSVLDRPRPRRFPYTVRKPMIAAINGAAAGLGLVQALYCDLRFCTPGAKLTTSFARRGLIAEYGMSWILARLLGPSRALDLLLSARVVLGEEALAMGLVDRLVEPGALLERAVAYADELATACSPTSMAVMKRQLRADLEAGFDAAYADAHRLLLESLERPDVREGVAAYLERRPPAFAPLAARSRA